MGYFGGCEILVERGGKDWISKKDNFEEKCKRIGMAYASVPCHDLELSKSRSDKLDTGGLCNNLKMGLILSPSDASALF